MNSDSARSLGIRAWLTTIAVLLLASSTVAQRPERVELLVRAVDGRSGAPVPSLMVVACSNSIGRVRSFARTDEHGLAHLGALPPGAYLVVSERRPPHAVTCAGVRLEAGAPGELTLALEGGRSISGVVVDHDGTPLEAADILWEPPFRSDRLTAFTHERPPLVVGRSGADGRFTIDHLDEIPTRLTEDIAPDRGRSWTIRLQGRTPALESARRLPAAIAEAGAHELKESLVIRPVALRAAGEVRQQDGRPAAGVLVTANLARVDACSAGLEFGRHEDDDPFAHPPRFWEPGFELRAGEAITDEHGRFELNVGADAAEHFRGPWDGRVWAVDRAARVARAMTWGRDAQRPEDLHLELPAAAPAYFRFVLPDGASVERSPRDLSFSPSVAFYPLEDPWRETTFLRTCDRPMGGAIIELVLADGRTVRSSRTSWGDGLCWIASEAPLADVRGLRAFVEGLRPIEELELNGLEVGRPLELQSQPAATIRLRVSSPEESPASEHDGERWTAWACLAPPEQRSEHGSTGPWWRHGVSSERVEPGCCGLGTRVRAMGTGSQVELDVPVQADAPYWIYLVRQRAPRQPIRDVRVFGPFDPGDGVHELELGSSIPAPGSPFVVDVPPLDAATPEAADLDQGTVPTDPRPPFRARLVRADGCPLMGPPAIGNRLGIRCGAASALLDQEDSIEVRPGPPAAFVLQVSQREAGVNRYWAIDMPSWDPNELHEVELPVTQPVELRVRGVDAARRCAALRVGVEPQSELCARAPRRPAWWDELYGPTIERGGGTPDARSFFLELAPGRYRFLWQGLLFDFAQTEFTVRPGAGTRQVVELQAR